VWIPFKYITSRKSCFWVILPVYVFHLLCLTYMHLFALGFFFLHRKFHKISVSVQKALRIKETFSYIAVLYIKRGVVT